MSQRPPRDLDWIPDDATGINVPSQTKQNAGWLIEKPARQFFNWLANRQSRWTHYFSGQSQEFIVIDSTNTNEKDYDTLAAYIAAAPAAGDKVLVKETQVLTAQMIIPDGITLRIIDGIAFTRSTLEANSVVKFGSDIIIEGVLNLVLSHTGTTAKALEFDGDNVVGKINVENSSTGTLTTVYHINASKTGNALKGFVKNTGGGAITNIGVDSSTEDSNLFQIIDKTSKQVFRSFGGNTFFDTSHGVYTPTLTNIANVDASTVRPAFWTRIGNVVTVSGIIDALDITTTGISTKFRITLPVASNLVGFWDLAGNGSSDPTTSAIDPMGIAGDTTNNEAQFRGVLNGSDVIKQFVSYKFSYEVI